MSKRYERPQQQQNKILLQNTINDTIPVLMPSKVWKNVNLEQKIY